MEILFVSLGGLILGLGGRYLLASARHTYGVLLLPAIGLAVSSALWVILTWFGLPWDGGIIWIIALGAAALAVFLTGLLLPKRRKAADTAMLTSLSGGLAID